MNDNPTCVCKRHHLEKRSAAQKDIEETNHIRADLKFISLFFWGLTRDSWRSLWTLSLGPWRIETGQRSVPLTSDIFECLVERKESVLLDQNDDVLLIQLFSTYLNHWWVCRLVGEEPAEMLIRPMLKIPTAVRNGKDAEPGKSRDGQHLFRHQPRAMVRWRNSRQSSSNGPSVWQTDGKKSRHNDEKTRR